MSIRFAKYQCSFSWDLFVLHHLENFLNKFSKFSSRYGAISVLINLIKYVIDLLSSRWVDTDLFGNLRKNLLELSSVENPIAIDIYFPEGLLHEFLHFFGIFHKRLQFFITCHCWDLMQINNFYNKKSCNKPKCKIDKQLLHIWMNSK